MNIDMDTVCLFLILALFVTLASELVGILLKAANGLNELADDCKYPNPRVEAATNAFKAIRKAAILSGIFILGILGIVIFIMVRQRFF